MLDSHRLRLTLLPLALLLVGLTACTSPSKPSTPKSAGWLDVVSPYRFDRVQGNVITREQFAVLKTGMQRNQVKDVLGTPLLSSVFHADRWDYVFTLRRQGTEPQARRVTVFFKGETLERFESDELPTEAEFVATLKSLPTLGKLPTMEASAESLQKFPVATQPGSPAMPAARPAADYPPLEPTSK